MLRSLTYYNKIIVNTSIQQAYNLVMNVEEYPNFIPILAHVKRIAPTIMEVGVEYGLWNGRFLCDVVATSPQLIRIQTKDENIDYMDCTWEFHEKQTQTEIIFRFELKFVSLIHQLLTKAVFPNITQIIFLEFFKRFKALEAPKIVSP